MPCMCGDTRCPSCGPAQGNNRCPSCGRWDDEGGCVNPKACEKECKIADQHLARGEVESEILGSLYIRAEPANWATSIAQFIYSDNEAGFWSNKDGWGSFDTASIYVKGDEDLFNLPSAGRTDPRWVGYAEAVTLMDDPNGVEGEESHAKRQKH